MRRSDVSNALRQETLQAWRDRPAAECTERALELFEDAVRSLQRAQGLSRAEAIRVIRRSRRAGRRPSRVAAGE